MNRNLEWFLIWLFLSAWLAVTWILIRYGRELWNRTQHLMAHTYYLQQLQIMSKLEEERGILNGHDSSDEGGDSAES
ncbi:MAG: hypothetical protein ACYCOU_09780 [Sulfobacillus sp.]